MIDLVWLNGTYVGWIQVYRMVGWFKRKLDEWQVRWMVGKLVRLILFGWQVSMLGDWINGTSILVGWMVGWFDGRLV